MSLRLVQTALLAIALGLAGCGQEEASSDDVIAASDMDAGGDSTEPSDLEIPNDLVGIDTSTSDAATDLLTSDDTVGSSTDSSADQSGPLDQSDDVGPSCVTDTVTYRVNAMACQWDFAGDYDSSVTNVYIQSANGARTQLCRSSRSACNVSWFVSDGRIVLCDLACLEVESAAAAGGAVVVEYGCPAQSCGGGCIPGGSPCSSETCCVGYHCSSSLCRSCGLGGASCNIDSQCCADNCESGTCIAPLRRACLDSSGCAAGECVDDWCTCTNGETACDGACVDLSVDDPANCGACGVVCRDDQVCSGGSCVCDPALGDRVECAGACVDTELDTAHCGACDSPCLAEQSCVAGGCACPSGEDVCGAECVDLQSDTGHCGTCDLACSSVQVCNGGTCECRPGLSACRGTCLDLLTDRANCGVCENVCNGPKICVAGACTNG